VRVLGGKLRLGLRIICIDGRSMAAARSRTPEGPVRVSIPLRSLASDVRASAAVALDEIGFGGTIRSWGDGEGPVARHVSISTALFPNAFPFRDLVSG
jgi:hypothetical protein